MFLSPLDIDFDRKPQAVRINAGEVNNVYGIEIYTNKVECPSIYYSGLSFINNTLLGSSVEPCLLNCRVEPYYASYCTFKRSTARPLEFLRSIFKFAKEDLEVSNVFQHRDKLANLKNKIKNSALNTPEDVLQVKADLEVMEDCQSKVNIYFKIDTNHEDFTCLYYF